MAFLQPLHDHQFCSDPSVSHYRTSLLLPHLLLIILHLHSITSHWSSTVNMYWNTKCESSSEEWYWQWYSIFSPYRPIPSSLNPGPSNCVDICFTPFPSIQGSLQTSGFISNMAKYFFFMASFSHFSSLIFHFSALFWHFSDPNFSRFTT